MRSTILYLLAAGLLVLIVSVAWWSRDFEEPEGPQPYVVRTGDTLASIAAEQGLSPAAIAAANGEEEGVMGVEPGETILIPPTPKTTAEVWAAHLAGLVAEIIGVTMSFWLALVAGMMPAHLRSQVFGIGLVLGVASYAATQATATGAPDLTPQFVFGAIKDGFAWSAAFPLFARAFGLRDAGGAGGVSPPVVPPSG